MEGVAKYSCRHKHVQMKCTIFENMLTTMNIESLPCCVFDSANTKSRLRCSHGTVGTRNGKYNLSF